MRPSPLVLGVAALLSLGSASGASADPYGYGYAGYPFAANAIDGTYIGAPFTRVPSTSRIVPPAWSYGTYGVPTIAGIREAPAARPTLYVIERRGEAADRPAPRRRARVLTKDTDGGWTEPPHSAAEPQPGARVVSLRVPVR